MQYTKRCTSAAAENGIDQNIRLRGSSVATAGELLIAAGSAGGGLHMLEDEMYSKG